MKKKIAYILLLFSLLGVVVSSLLSAGYSNNYRPYADIGFGLQCGIIGFVYVVILTKPGAILARFGEWLRKQFMLFHVEPTTGTVDVERMNRHEWWLKPMLTCEACVSGQLALWGYIFYARSFWSLNGHVSAICMAVLTASIFSLVWKRS